MSKRVHCNVDFLAPSALSPIVPCPRAGLEPGLQRAAVNSHCCGPCREAGELTQQPPAHPPPEARSIRPASSTASAGTPLTRRQVMRHHGSLVAGFHDVAYTVESIRRSCCRLQRNSESTKQKSRPSSSVPQKLLYKSLFASVRTEYPRRAPGRKPEKTGFGLFCGFTLCGQILMLSL